MSTVLDERERARLIRNARMFTYDAILERVAEMFHTDHDAWSRLPQVVRSEASVYIDLRQHYRAAVDAGVIQADRGPTAAPNPGGSA